MSEIIYERKYFRKTEEEERQEVEVWFHAHPENGEKAPWMSFADFCLDMINKRTLVLLSDRVPLAPRFIDLAIERGEIYEMDTTITRHDSGVSVLYKFDETGSMDLLVPLLRMTDSISIWQSKERPSIAISLTYYTHAVYHGKRLVQPYELLKKNEQ